MIKNIYIITILIIILLAIYIFINNYSDYEYQLDKINKIESLNKKRKKKMKYYRETTEPCKQAGLKTPRDCYFNSNYKCSWDELADRCNLK